MATATVVGLSTGKRFLTCSLFSSDISDKLSYINDYASLHYQTVSAKNSIVAKKPSGCRSQPIKQQLEEHVDTTLDASAPRSWFQGSNDMEKEEEIPDFDEEEEEEDDDDEDDDQEEEIPDLDQSVEALLLLQKSMLEKQWNLSFERTALADSPGCKTHEKIPVTGSGVSARQRRINTKKRNHTVVQPSAKQLLGKRLKGYVRGVVSKELLSHSEVMCLSEKIKGGVRLEEHKSRWTSYILIMHSINGLNSPSM